jgi:hypothetical protein
MSRYISPRVAHAAVDAASPYAYRLPPDTFLSRRDPGFYIGDAIGPTPAGLPESGKREILAARASLALHQMADLLDSVANAQFSTTSLAGKTAVAAAVPVVGTVVLPAIKNAVQAKSFLTEARDKIRKPSSRVAGPVEVAVGVARDTSIPLAEASRRIEEFLTSYAADLDGQIKNALSSADIFGNAARSFKDGVKQVLAETRETLVPEDKDIPVWVWAAGGLASLIAVAYIVGKVK